MRKEKWYYFVPFVVNCFAMLLITGVNFILKSDDAGFFFLIVMSLVGFAVGVFSPTKRKFDHLSALLMVLSFIVMMFLLAFLEDNGETISRFDFSYALRVALSSGSLVFALTTGVATLLGSYSGLRHSIRSFLHKK